MQRCISSVSANSRNTSRVLPFFNGIFLIALLTLTLCSCGKNADQYQVEDIIQQSETATEETTTEIIITDFIDG